MTEPGFHPLAGIRVVDLTSNMSGPLATMVLADQGADVVKVEPPEGDLIRTVGTGNGGMSAYFANLNRGKRSIAVDLSTGVGVEVVRRLAADADVFVQNFRPGVVERLGLDADRLMAANPRLVYGSISGFGPHGPLATQPAYDHVVQALSGFAAIQAGSDGPDLVRQGAIDKASAYTLAQAITAALLQRVSTGRGVRIDVSMLDVALAFLWPDGMMNDTCLEDVELLPPVSRSFRTTPTADGHVVLVTLTAKQWDGLVSAILTEEGDDTGGDLSDTGARMAGGATIMRAVRQRIRELSTDEVVERLRRADVPCAPVRELGELHLDPQIAASGILEVVDHPVMGRIRQPGPAPVVDGVRPRPGDPAPAVGAHTREVLGERGFSAAEIDTLFAEGVVR
ncbi:CaiB/BaiF CoA transferase family protein [Rhabdothermincola sp.]|uniref:CaiB/BaiF CoA transferase family protein n=1 Tax=Rhabdothermincola sp. TaxID=2820405 RepID=UPI002FE19FC0